MENIDFKLLDNSTLLSHIVADDDHDTEQEFVPNANAIAEMQRRGFENLLSFSDYCGEFGHKYGTFFTLEAMENSFLHSISATSKDNIYGGDLKRNV